MLVIYKKLLRVLIQNESFSFSIKEIKFSRIESKEFKKKNDCTTHVL